MTYRIYIKFKDREKYIMRPAFGGEPMIYYRICRRYIPVNDYNWLNEQIVNTNYHARTALSERFILLNSAIKKRSIVNDNDVFIFKEV